MHSRLMRRALVQATRSLGLAGDDATTIVERRGKSVSTVIGRLTNSV